MAGGEDPRLNCRADDAPLIGESEPVVGAAPSQSSRVLIIAAFAALAIALFVLLNARRDAGSAQSLIAPAAANAAEPAPLPPLQIGPTPSKPAPAPTPASAPRVAPPPLPTAAKPEPKPDPMLRRRAPSVVVDLGMGTTQLAAAANPVATSGGPGIAGALARNETEPSVVANAGTPPRGPISVTPGSGGLAFTAIAAQNALGAAATAGGSAEQFARRVGAEEPSQARATELPNLESLIPQGTVIPGVLETAINSDLPGFTRAIVSRDVWNFDGTAVLIPRGSRLIGQYKSAVALGDTRAFIIWTRIIRPDGASILIGSPGGDALGRGGLSGNVDRHFFQRFGGSILLSVLNAGIAAIGGVPATQVTIGSPGAAIGAASTVTSGDAIPPTVKVPQGTTIRIFVARDLDFSAVGPAK